MDANLLHEACISALACERETGVPAELTVAQWALESGWGSHCPGNNPFGIKGNSTTGQLLSTTEYFATAAAAATWVAKIEGRVATGVGGTKYACRDWFAKFESLGSAFMEHAKLFLGGAYLRHLQSYSTDKSLGAFVAGIGPIYATDPKYSDEIMAIVGMQVVRDGLTQARGEI